MQRRNFIKLLSGALLTPLAALLPKRDEEEIVEWEIPPDYIYDSWGEGVRVYAPTNESYYYVNSQFDESIPNHFRKLSDACEHAGPGDTIFIMDNSIFNSGEFRRV